MIRRIQLFVAFLILSAGFGWGVTSILAAQPLRLLGGEKNAEEAKEVVNDFFEFGMSLKGIDSLQVKTFAVDWFAEYLYRHRGETFWPVPHRYHVDEVYSAHPSDSLLIVTSRAWPDSVPFVGRVTVDWIWFLRQNEAGEWRISSVRRTQGIHEAIQVLRLIDTSSAYPNSIREEMAREKGAILMSNEQIRQEFSVLRPQLETLVDLFGRYDSLMFVGREGDRVNQFNQNLLDWGMATQDIPEEVIAEYLATATEEERRNVEARLKAAEKQRYQGEERLRKWERQTGLPSMTLDEVVLLMKQGRIRFVNAALPWKDAIQFTIAGKLDNALGLLYSPHGELPVVTPEEYFYLEDLGEGWWIFRSVR